MENFNFLHLILFHCCTEQFAVLFLVKVKGSVFLQVHLGYNTGLTIKGNQRVSQ